MALSPSWCKRPLFVKDWFSTSDGVGVQGIEIRQTERCNLVPESQTDRIELMTSLITSLI